MVSPNWKLGWVILLWVGHLAATPAFISHPPHFSRVNLSIVPHPLSYFPHPVCSPVPPLGFALFFPLRRCCFPTFPEERRAIFPQLWFSVFSAEMKLWLRRRTRVFDLVGMGESFGALRSLSFSCY